MRARLHGAGKTVTDGDRLPGKRATSALRRVAERVDREGARLGRCCLCQRHRTRSPGSVRSVRLELARHELVGRAVVTPMCPPGDRALVPAALTRARAPFRTFRRSAIEMVCGRTRDRADDARRPCCRRPVQPDLPAPAGLPAPPGADLAAKSERRSDRGATFAELTALLRSFGFVTAPVWSCGAPTLFRASWLTAATLVPPSARSSARQATIIAGDGRRRSFLMSKTPFSLRRARLPLVSVDPWRTPRISYVSRTQTRTDSKYSPARRPVRRLTCRSSRSSSLSPLRRRISGYRSRRSLTTTSTGAPSARCSELRASTVETPAT